MSLFSRLFLFFIITAIPVYAGSLWYLLTSSADTQRLALQQQIQSSARVVAPQLASSMLSQPASSHQQVLKTLFDGTIDRASVLNAQGGTLLSMVSSDLPSQATEVAVTPVPPWFSNLFSGLHQVTASEAISSTNTSLGTLQVTAKTEGVLGNLWASFCECSFVFLMGFAVLSLLLWGYLKWLLSPVKRIISQTQSIADSRFLVERNIPSTTEFAQLTEAMNSTVNSVQSVVNGQLSFVKKVQAETSIDEVTGLLNRSAFDHWLHQLAHDDDRGLHSAAFCILSLSNVSDVNELAGREAGNDVLKAVAEKLSALLQDYPESVVSRRQGGEFAVLVPDLTQDEAEKFASLVFQSAQTVSWQHYVDCPLQFHMGYSFTFALDDPVAVLGETDVALRQAKLSNAGRWVKYTEVQPSDAPVLNRSLDEWKVFLEGAIDQRSVALHFQPVVTSITEKRLGYEVFARFLNGDDLIHAGVVLPTVERLGLSSRLDQLVLEQVAAKFRDCDGTDEIYVNLSVSAVQAPSFIRWLDAFLGTQQQLANRLVLELSDSMLRNTSSLTPFVELLQKRSVRFSLDNFGIGKTSFGHINGLPLHYLKIHRSYIFGVDAHVDNQFYIRSLAQVAHQRGMLLYVEGVETEAEWNKLKSLGVDAGQGFYIGMPQAQLLN